MVFVMILSVELWNSEKRKKIRNRELKILSGILLSWMDGNTINIFFVLPSSAERDYTIKEFSNELSEYIGDVPEAENLTVGGFSFGGSPISVRFQSVDYNQLMESQGFVERRIESY